jgi:hypothetical protein
VSIEGGELNDALSLYHFRKHESYRLKEMSKLNKKSNRDTYSLTSLHSGASEEDIL